MANIGAVVVEVPEYKTTETCSACLTTLNAGFDPDLVPENEDLEHHKAYGLETQYERCNAGDDHE